MGGWPFVLGFSINEDSGLIAIGTKSKDTSVVDAKTGKVLWLKQTGSLVLISPDGNYVANFYGDIFEARTGKLVGQTGIQAVVLFSNDSKYLIQADRGQVSIVISVASCCLRFRSNLMTVMALASNRNGRIYPQMAKS